VEIFRLLPLSLLLSLFQHRLASSDPHTGYSGSDLKGLLGEAALGPIRELGFAALESVAVSEVPAISHGHFISALKQVRASVNPDELHLYEEWNAQFGSFGEALDADID